MKKFAEFWHFYNFTVFLFVIIRSTGAELAPDQYKLCAPDKTGRVPAVEMVDISGCTKPPCAMYKGKMTTLQVVFTADDDYPQVVNMILGEVAGMRKGFPGVDSKNACDKLYLMPEKIKTDCPLEKGKQYLYEIQVAIKSFFPPITAVIVGGLKEKTTKKVITCFETMGKIV